MATVLDVRGLTRMIELPPKPRKPQPLINSPEMRGRSASSEAPPAMHLDAAADAAAKADEEQKKAAAAAAARDELPRMRVIFSNVSFALNRGTTLAIVGPAKCGKTQLLRVRLPVSVNCLPLCLMLVSHSPLHLAVLAKTPRRLHYFHYCVSRLRNSIPRTAARCC